MGGALFMFGSSAEISSCDFEANHANTDGGAVRCEEGTPIFTGCGFSANTAASSGGAICFEFAQPTVSECEFTENQADDGGAVYCGLGQAYYHFTTSIFWDNTATRGGALRCHHGCSIDVDGCTFYGNYGSLGSGIYFYDTYSPCTLDKTIIAAGIRASAVYCETAGSLPILTCCDIYGNSFGDWVGCIEGQNGVSGNISEDPLFCEPVGGDFRLDCASPCADGYGCGQIGACGIGCGASAVEPRTWSTIKALYR
jgi:predicted outer membrane repeat protein